MTTLIMFTIIMVVFGGITALGVVLAFKEIEKYYEEIGEDKEKH